MTDSAIEAAGKKLHEWFGHDKWPGDKELFCKEAEEIIKAFLEHPGNVEVVAEAIRLTAVTSVVDNIITGLENPQACAQAAISALIALTEGKVANNSCIHIFDKATVGYQFNYEFCKKCGHMQKEQKDAKI